MSKFKVVKKFNYPLEEVFRGFMKITKREFPKFNDKNPIGNKHSKVIKDNGSTKIRMILEVTNFEKNKVYEVTSRINSDVYVARYTFEKISEEKTKVILEEEQHMDSLISKIAVIIQGFIARSKAKKKIDRMSDGVIEEIEALRYKMEKNAKKA